MREYKPRKYYIDQIKPFIGKDIIKVLVWQRRVGKSYLVYQLIDHIKQNGVSSENIIHINKELLDWEHIRNYKDLMEATKGYDYIFVDEIQEIKDWDKTIRSLQAQWDKDIYITWSNSKLLSSEISTHLSGRFKSFDIYPLNYKEFLQFHDLESNQEIFYKYIKFGGLPYLINLDLEEDVVYGYLEDIKDAILLNDIVSRFNIRNIDFFKRLLVYMARQVGNIFSAENISDYLKSQNIKISNKTVLKYLQYAQSALFLNQIDRYDIKGKKTFEIRHKYFFTDVGIRNVLAGGYKQTDISGVLENIVYNNLVSNNWEVNIGQIGKKEIDFIATKWWKKIYIQVSYILETQKTIDREFGVYKKVSDNRDKYVISMDENAGWYVNGVKHQNIMDFVYSLCDGWVG